MALNGKTTLHEHWQLEGAVYARALRQRHVDGNDGDFEICSGRSSFGGDLCLEDDAFGTPPGGKTTAFRNQFVIVDATGNTFAFDPSAIYGTVDHTFTDTVSDGFTAQVSSDAPWFGLSNYLTFGASLDHSAISFQSNSTLGRIYPDLHVGPDAALPGSGAIVRTMGKSRLCASHPGGRHRLLWPLCGGRTRPDAGPDADRGLSPQCRRHHHP